MAMAVVDYHVVKYLNLAGFAIHGYDGCMRGIREHARVDLGTVGHGCLETGEVHVAW